MEVEDLLQGSQVWPEGHQLTQVEHRAAEENSGRKRKTDDGDLSTSLQLVQAEEGRARSEGPALLLDLPAGTVKVSPP